MNYNEAVNFIHGTYKFGMKLGLDNITTLLGYMGDPQNKLKFIHLAGTNGKGSTGHMISNVLKESNYKTGLFISPYLEKFTERIQINGHQISPDDLARVTSFVKDNIQKMLDEGLTHPTEFEVVTAIGLQYFYEEKVDFVVLEVGMGGRFDATNVINTPEVAVITSISMDHMQYLGNTIEEIAFEKAGIIKKNGNVVLYPQKDNVEKVIEDICNKRMANLYKCNRSKIELSSYSLDGQNLIYKGSSILPNFEFKLNLLGDHQINNSLTALTVLEILIKNGYHITIDSIKRGMKTIVFPGRFEILSKNPTIIIDGAHNEGGINSLVASIKKYINRKVVLIFGVLADKDFSPMIRSLTEITDKIYTVTPNNPRALESDSLAETIRDYNTELEVHPLSSIKEGAAIAQNGSQQNVYLFAGSLYMIGEVRSILTN